ncbi:hyaluronate lyase N-terminal domain-containing protein [Lutibacter maritimus]|uniref:Major tropism determinant N-terminal domain-containing protein n=1 Tax=Lutibacter maritimus TaxID=593133 RepID=A0A1I6NSI2_9FLAO|nr:hypothetical protein [Lutibacter maritimus]SFS30851.1 hypothetical protein SAMN04488006_0496 [Lutibacter maritimus]
MADIIQIRRGTAALWTSRNPTLAEGEEGYETDTGKEKRGDGVTAWNDLQYKTVSSADPLNLGYYATESALRAAHPTGIEGNYAIVGATDTVWIWDVDTPDWVDSGSAAGLLPINSVGYAELKPAFKTIIDLGNVSGTVNLDWSLAVRYKLHLIGNVTLTMTKYADYAGAKVQDLHISSSSPSNVITWQTGVNVADFDDVPIDFTTSGIVNYISAQCLNGTTPIFRMSNYLRP